MQHIVNRFFFHGQMNRNAIVMQQRNEHIVDTQLGTWHLLKYHLERAERIISIYRPNVETCAKQVWDFKMK